MEYKDKDLSKLLEDKLKQRLNDIVFLDLNKDLYFGESIEIDTGVPMPIRSDKLINGIKNGEYEDKIPFEQFAEAMIFVIGCDRNFKYNDTYIRILKKINSKMDSYIMSSALKFAEDGNYLNALIFFNALDQISDNLHRDARYNIANALRELAVSAKNRDDDEYKLYYELSYLKFVNLSKEYPDFAYPHYHLGFYHQDKGEYGEALKEWEEAHTLAPDKGVKDAAADLIDSVREKMSFEKGREEIVVGDITEGLKQLIPLVEKYETWSEAKYFIALGYRKLGNYKKAQVLLNELLDSGEEFHEIYNELGLCCFYLGDISESVKNLELAVRLKDDEPGYLCNLGIAYYQSGDDKKAEEYINKAYKLNPDDELTKRCKTWIDSVQTSGT